MIVSTHRWFLFACVVSAIAFNARAGAQSASQVPSIRVSGEATLHVLPDQAEVDLGVVTSAETSRLAASKNASLLQNVLGEVRAALGQGGEVRSVAYSIRPDYRPQKIQGESRISGYTARNIVRVTLTDLMKLSEVIDTATGAGANRIEGVRYSLRSEDAVAAQALREAATKARAQADALAGALGVRVVRVLAASETATPVRPFVSASALSRGDGASPATPFEVGPIEVSATVSLTVQISSSSP